MTTTNNKNNNIEPSAVADYVGPAVPGATHCDNAPTLQKDDEEEGGKAVGVNGPPYDDDDDDDTTPKEGHPPMAHVVDDDNDPVEYLPHAFHLGTPNEQRQKKCRLVTVLLVSLLCFAAPILGGVIVLAVAKPEQNGGSAAASADNTIMATPVPSAVLPTLPPTARWN